MKLIMEINELGQSLIKRCQSIADRILDRIPEEKRRFFLLSLSGLVFLAICLTIAALAIGPRAPVNPREMRSGYRIPAEELFYPQEPDFLPPLLMERNPRQPWTTGDLELFWLDPKTGNEEKWLETAKAVVDRLMDGVP
jgi:hypothetical protein